VKERSAARLAWVLLCCIVLLVVAVLAISVETGSGVDGFSIASLSFPIVGALIASRQPRNTLGWILLGVGVGWGLGAVLDIATTSTTRHERWRGSRQGFETRSTSMP
jgi:hypothetical protein